MTEKFATKAHLMIALAGVVVTVPVFAFTTFVTLRERDLLRAANEQRISQIEQGQKETRDKLNEISGKMDATILLLKKVE